MTTLNLDEYHAKKARHLAERRARRRAAFREKLLLVALAGGASILFGAPVVQELLPKPVVRVSGLIVDKEWRKPYQERHKHGTEWHPARFLVWVANRESVRAVPVDSATWQGLKIGQRSSYRFRDSWF